MNQSSKDSEERMDVEEPRQQQNSIIEINHTESQCDFLKFPQSTSMPFSFAFCLNKSLYDENQSVSHMICSKKYNSKRILSKKQDANRLLMDSSNLRGQKYQSFIPNKVNLKEKRRLFKYSDLRSRIASKAWDHEHIA